MKIWCISDTHGKQSLLDVPSDVDMVVCSGDIGTVRDTSNNAAVCMEFIRWYKSLSHIKYKVLCAGNHDTAIEAGSISRGDIGDDIVYLEHESAIVGGLKVFSSPYTPSFGHGWAFNVARHKLNDYWKDIPNDTDILITHGPPKGILDYTSSGSTGGQYVQCGCKSLLNHVLRVNPKIHVFGHIHPEEDCPNASIQQIQGSRTKFINAAVVDLSYQIHNNGFIVEI